MTSLIVITLTIFVMFYSVALVGNGVQIFKIINSIDDSEDNNALSEDDKELYNSFRLTALGKAVLLIEQFSPDNRIAEYRNTIETLIEA